MLLLGVWLCSVLTMLPVGHSSSLLVHLGQRCTHGTPEQLIPEPLLPGQEMHEALAVLHSPRSVQGKDTWVLPPATLIGSHPEH